MGAGFPATQALDQTCPVTSGSAPRRIQQAAGQRGERGPPTAPRRGGGHRHAEDAGRRVRVLHRRCRDGGWRARVGLADYRELAGGHRRCTRQPGDDGGHDVGRRARCTRRILARRGWVVSRRGRVVAGRGWAVARRGRVVSGRGRVVSGRGRVVARRGRVVAGRGWAVASGATAGWDRRSCAAAGGAKEIRLGRIDLAVGAAVDPAVLGGAVLPLGSAGLGGCDREQASGKATTPAGRTIRVPDHAGSRGTGPSVVDGRCHRRSPARGVGGL